MKRDQTKSLSAEEKVICKIFSRFRLCVLI